MKLIKLVVVLLFAISRASTATRYKKASHQDFEDRHRLAISASDGPTISISTLAPKRGVVSSLASRLHQRFKSIVASPKPIASPYKTEPTISETPASATAVTAGIVGKFNPFNNKLISQYIPLLGNSTLLNKIKQSDTKITAVNTIIAPNDTPESGIIVSSFSALSEKLLSLLKDAVWFLIRSVPGFVARTFMYVGICSPSTTFCKIMTTLESSVELFVKINTMSISGQVTEVIAYILNTAAIFGQK